MIQRTLIFLFIFLKIITAQDWTAEFWISPNPSPYVSDWLTDPSTARLTLNNLTDKKDVVYVEASITDDDGNVIFTGRSPRILVFPNEPYVIYSTDLNDWKKLSVQSGLENQIQRTGMLPESDGYEICINVINQWGNLLIEDFCQFAGIIHSEPPELIYPIENETVNTNYPNFQWLPAGNGNGILYTLRIVEQLQNQTPERALQANYPFFEKFDISTVNYVYPLEAPPLEQNTVYIWEIIALDMEGRPASKNYGKSEYGIFKTGEENSSFQLSDINLISPQNHSQAAGNSIEFEWLLDPPAMNTDIFYTLKIYKMNPNQSPEQAVQMNPTVFSNNEILTETKITIDHSAEIFQDSQYYAWNVQALNAFGESAVSGNGYSGINVFMYSAGGSSAPPLEPVDSSDYDLPEKLPLLNEEIAYLLLRKDGKNLVHFSFSSDSSQLIIKSSSVPLIIPKSDGGSSFSIPAETDIYFNRYSLEITKGSVKAQLPANEELFFSAEKNIPLSIKEIVFSPETSSSLNLKGNLNLFHTSFSNLIEYSINDKGEISVDFQNVPLSNPIPLVKESSKLNLFIEELNGELTASLLENNTDYSFTAAGKVEFSGLQGTPYLPVELSISPETASLTQSPGSGISIRFPCGNMNFQIQEFTCEYLNYYSSAQTWAFDFQGKLSWTFHFSGTAFSLPEINTVHMSRLGIEIPRIEQGNLGINSFFPYRNVFIKPYAFRSLGKSFDWFHWEENNSPSMDFYFDLEVSYPSLARGFEKLNQYPLTVQNAEMKGDILIGDSETRKFLNPIEVFFLNENDWGFSINKISGGFQEQGDFQTRIQGDIIAPDYFQNRLISLDSSWLDFTVPGFIRGDEQTVSISQSIKWDSLMIDPEISTISFIRGQSAQEIILDFQGTIQIPVNNSEFIKGLGKGKLELISNTLKDGEFKIDSPFDFRIPEEKNILPLKCLKGAEINASGLVLKNDKGNLITAAGETLEVSYKDNLTLELPNLKYKSGAIEFSEPLAFRLSNWLGGSKGLNWECVTPQTSVSEDRDEVIIPLPDGTKLSNNTLNINGEEQGTFRVKNETYNGVKSIFSQDFAINIEPWQVKKGKAEFFIHNEKAAVLDSSGFRLTDFFGAVLSSNKLPLPDTSIAYIELENNENLIIEDINGKLKLTTKENKNISVYFPSLKYGGTDIPVIPAQVDVLIDPITLSVESGSITHDSLLSLSLKDRSIPLEICRLNYDESHELKIGIRPILPAALKDDNIVFDSISVNQNGIGSFNKGYLSSYSSVPPKNKTVLGEKMYVELNGMKANMLAAPPEIAFSGDIYSSCFQNENGQMVPLHFTALSLNEDTQFSLHLQHLTAENYKLPLGCGELELIEKNGALAASVIAPMDSNYFGLKMNGVYHASGLSDNFAMTFNNIEINGNGMTIPSLNIPLGEEQILELYGTEWILSGKQNIEFIDNPTGITLILQGTTRILGEDIPFTNFIISSDCSIQNQTISKEKFTCLDSMLTIDTLSIKNNCLAVSGKIRPPEPFSGDGTENFVIKVNPQGQTCGNSNHSNELIFTLVDDADSNKPGTLFGKEGLQIEARISKLILDLGENIQELTGNLNIEINTLWPGGNQLTLTGELPLEKNRNPVWTIDQSPELSVEFAGLLKMNILTVTIPDTSEFQFCLSGNCAPLLPDALVSGGVDFDRFILKKEDFLFGAIYNGNLDIGGLVIEISHFTFGKDIDISTYDADLNSGTCESSEKKIADFYLDFSGSLSLSLTAFGGGIDRLLVYKTQDFFHLLIQNAYISGGDYFNGGLDLIADIPLQTEDFQFKFVIGGHVDFMGKGMAAVGELSFKETTLGNQTFKAPGFGIFLAAIGVDIDLKPLPIVINDLGVGLFVNPAPEIEEIVRRHVGLNNSDLDQADFFTALNDYKDSFSDQMTFLEMYLYGKISIPKDKVLSGKALILLATDKVRIDCKFDIGDTTMQKICKLTARGFLEVGVPQDMSSWPYAAGNLTFAAAPGTNGGGDKFIRLPSLGEAALEFYIAGPETWALHGYLDTYLFALLHTDFEFFIGPPGFVVNGSVTKGFDIVVVKVEAGMEVCVFFRWNEPRIWGGYGSVWVEGSLLGGVLASARGEMGAALVGEPDFYLYGYAELTGSVLGISKTFQVWAQWKDGEIDAGTGEGEGLQEAIAYSQAIANEIMGQAEEVESEIISLRQAELAQLNTEQTRAIVTNLKNGMNTFYTESMKADQQLVLSVLNSNSQDEKILKNAFNQYVNRVLEVFSSSKMEELNQTLDNWETASGNASSALDSLLMQYQEAFNSVQTELSDLNFALDTLTIISSKDYVLSNPLTVSSATDPETGITLPSYEIDGNIAEQNRDNAEYMKNAMEEWLVQISSQLTQLKNLRENIYNKIGPKSKIAGFQENFNESLLDKIRFSEDLLLTTSKLYENYYQAMDDLRSLWYVKMPDGSISYIHNLLKQARVNNQALQIAGTSIREAALQKLSNGTVELPSDVFQGWQKYDLLTQHFYRTVPSAFLNFTLMSLDSVFQQFIPIYNKTFEARRDIHREFTKQMDLIWDQYALFSDNIYHVFSEYIQNGNIYEENTGKTFPGFTEDKESFAKLQNEFIFPSLDFQVNQENFERYEPTPLSLSWGGNTNNSSELAYGISSNTDSELGFQSLGGLNRTNLEYLLSPGWFVWKYNIIDGISSWEIESSLPETKEFTIQSRVRNLAGYAAKYDAFDITLSGKGRDSKIEETKPPFDYEIYNVYLNAYPKCGFNNDYTVLNNINSLKVNFSIQNGTELRRDLNYMVTINKVDISNSKSQKIFGPVSVVPYLTENNEYEFIIENCELEPNTLLPYKIFLESTIGDDKPFGTGFLYQGGFFYYDTEPPGYRSSQKIELLNDGGRLYGKIPKAYDSPYPGGYGEMISSLNDYEIIYYIKGQSPDTMDWQSISYYTDKLPAHRAGDNKDTNYPKITIPLDYYPYVDSAFIAVKVKNSTPYRNNGYSDIYTMAAPPVKDTNPPTDAYVNLAGISDEGDLLLKFTCLGGDYQSGIKGYAFQLLDSKDSSIILRPFKQNRRIDLPADSADINQNFLLTIPSGLKNVLPAKMFLKTRVYDRSKNYSDRTTVILLPPSWNIAETNITIPEEIKPWKLKIVTALDIEKAKTGEIYGIEFSLGTTPGGNDVFKDMFFNLSLNTNPGEGSTHFFKLPESIEPNTQLYFTGKLMNKQFIRSEKQSLTVHTPYPEMIKNIRQEGDKIILEIATPGFGGLKEANYQYALGKTNFIYTSDGPAIKESNPFDFSLRPFPGNGVYDFYGPQVQKGGILEIPVSAEDIWPLTVIALKAVGLSGDSSLSYISEKIVPPAPVLNGNIISRDDQLILNFSSGMGARIRASSYTKMPFVEYSIGIGYDIDNIILKDSLPVNPYNPNSNYQNNINLQLPDSLRAYEKIYICAVSITSERMISKDTAVLELNMPLMPMLKETYLDREDRIHAAITGRGVYQEGNALGYQFSLGICNDSVLTIRPWPASLEEFDFTPSEVVPGSELILQVDRELIPRFRYGKIGLRVITKDGQIRENFGNCFLSCPPIKGEPLVRQLNGNEYEFRFAGIMNSSMTSHARETKFMLGTESGDGNIFEESINPDWQGNFHNIRSFSGTFESGQILYLRTSYKSSWDSLIVWDTIISFTGSPMFSSISENEEQYPVIPIENLPFDGKLEIAGYKFAVANYYQRSWSDSILYDIRAFPAENFDFIPSEIIQGNSLVLPIHSKDLISKVIIALKGITAEGAEQINEIVYSPLPPKPIVTPLKLILGKNPPPLQIEISKETVNSQVHGIKVWLTDDLTDNNLLVASPPVYVALKHEGDGRITAELPNWYFLSGHTFTLKTVSVNLSTGMLSPVNQVRFRFEEIEGEFRAVIINE